MGSNWKGAIMGGTAINICWQLVTAYKISGFYTKHSHTILDFCASLAGLSGFVMDSLVGCKNPQVE